jgi:hypothetical protein
MASMIIRSTLDLIFHKFQNLNAQFYERKLSWPIKPIETSLIINLIPKQTFLNFKVH